MEENGNQQANRKYWTLKWKSCFEHWDSPLTVAVFTISIFLLIVAMVISHISYSFDKFNLLPYCSTESFSPKADYLSMEEQNDTDAAVVLMLLCCVVHYAVAGGTGIVVAVQGWKSRSLLKRQNQLLTTAYILPCYAPLYWFNVVMSMCGLGVSIYMLRIGEMVVDSEQLMHCTGSVAPLQCMYLVLPVLMLQRSVSKAAMLRSISISVLVTILMSIVILHSSRYTASMFYIIGGFIWLTALAYLNYYSYSRQAFQYHNTVLASSIFCVVMSRVILLSVPGHKYAGMMVLVLGICIIVFSTVAGLVSLRADTKYWLGTKVNQYGTQDQSDMAAYLKHIADVGVNSTFSTRTSVYHVHGMIEEHKKCMIDHKLLKLDAIIDQGATSSVVKATMKGTGSVAVKVYTSLDINDNEVYRFTRETAFNARLTHPNIVVFHGLCVVPPVISLVFEFCSHGSLDSVLRTSTHWDNTTKLRAALDAAEAVAYLHSFSPPLLHRDIKTCNFLVDDEYVVKLSDFGESNLLRPDTDGTMTIIGSASFMAPELILGTKNLATYGTPADIYALSICLWSIFSPGTLVWDGYNNIQVYNAVVEGRRPLLHSAIPSAMADMLEQCWSTNPEHRLSASDIVQKLRFLFATAAPQQELMRTRKTSKFESILPF